MFSLSTAVYRNCVSCLAVLLLLPTLLLVVRCQQIEFEMEKSYDVSVDSTTASIGQNELDGAGQRGSETVDQAIRFEFQLVEEHQDEILLQSDSPSYFHQQLSRPTLTKITNNQIISLARDALKVIEASRHLQLQFNMAPDQVGLSLPIHSTRGTVLEETCKTARIICPIGSKYRSIDGSCNNVERSEWGMALTSFGRLLPPNYSDGVFSPRKDLPSARLISEKLIRDADRTRPDITLMLMVFGQFVSHDLNLAPVFVLPESRGNIECCKSDGSAALPPDALHSQCLPIEISNDDPFFRQFGQRCMNFVRSFPAPRTDCSFGYAQQLNAPTHWLDGSQIYGNDEVTLRKLRESMGGRLRSTRINGRQVLPVDPQSSSILTGDVRATEQPQLTMMHTLWLREHNRIAETLAKLNPAWNDEQIFQESRRIVIAQLQHIVYNEFLPIVLGEGFMVAFNLKSTALHQYNEDDDETDPSITNEFATAAFRFGHSLIQGLVKLFSSNGQLDRNRSFPLSMLNGRAPPINTDDQWIDDAIRGLLSQTVQDLDSFITEEVTNNLFRGGRRFGLDLAAINIQRGRDHGLPGYNNYRQFSGLERAIDFQDLSVEIPKNVIEAMKRVYRSVDDIDLFVGGLAEMRAVGDDALLGPTFKFIVGDQFVRLKRADRFFYDLIDQPHSFNPQQLEQIKRISLARIVCDNNEGSVQSIQPLTMKAARDSNRAVQCSSIPKLDLSSWIGETIF